MNAHDSLLSTIAVAVMSSSMLLSIASNGHQAFAQTGVSDDRVSLPEGPGSLEGIGENVEFDPNMGNMTHSVSIDLPQGFPGVTPKLALGYSSGAGGSVVGMGWSLRTPSIERMTYRGLPEYDRDDDFAVGGSEQLVRIPGTEPPVYRARQEKSFVRYTWHVDDTGDAGYWKAEYPDGRVGYFGADARGNRVDAAHIDGDEGTFRYHLVEMVDRFGHSMICTWRKDEANRHAYIQQIGYLYLDSAAPRYSVTFGFEPRSDDTGFDILSDAKAGFNDRTTERLANINVFSGRERIRRYVLTYEPYATSGGFTRLVRVEKFGLTGERYPVVFDFGYSRALGGVCEAEESCQRPFVVDMGSIGVDLGSRQGTLIDINGDALPDVVHTPPGQDHRFFLNIPDAQGASRFETVAATSALPTSAFQLGTPYVHVMDVNGDGFTDLINARTGQFLMNTGQGDWEELVSLGGTADLPDFEADFELGGENELRTIRFLDFDNDKRIDVMRASTGGTSMFRNRDGLGFVAEEGVEPLGANFETDTLQLTDMNGDGLIDLVQLFPGRLRYRLNLGRARWGDWFTIVDLPITNGNITLVE
ncbi:MAG: SpvB/TcaC N-terminal domain-containing protein, partial [Myxococcota bacterium]